MTIAVGKEKIAMPAEMFFSGGHQCFQAVNVPLYMAFQGNTCTGPIEQGSLKFVLTTTIKDLLFDPAENDPATPPGMSCVDEANNVMPFAQFTASPTPQDWPTPAGKPKQLAVEDSEAAAKAEVADKAAAKAAEEEAAKAAEEEAAAASKQETYIGIAAGAGSLLLAFAGVVWARARRAKGRRSGNKATKVAGRCQTRP